MIIWLVGAIYLLSCILIISDSNLLIGMVYSIQILFFICCLKYLANNKNNFIWLFFSGLVFYTFLGLVNGNHPSFFARDFMSFIVVVTILLFVNDNRDFFTQQLINFLTLKGTDNIFSIYFLR